MVTGKPCNITEAVTGRPEERPTEPCLGQSTSGLVCCVGEGLASSLGCSSASVCPLAESLGDAREFTEEAMA